MKIRKREIAKVGIFGSKDNPQIVNEKDLMEIAETFAEIQKAPVSLNGHWRYSAFPDMGLKRPGGGLYLHFPAALRVRLPLVPSPQGGRRMYE